MSIQNFICFKVQASTKENTLFGPWSNWKKFKTAEGSMKIFQIIEKKERKTKNAKLILIQNNFHYRTIKDRES